MNIFSIPYSSPLGTIVIESAGECLTGLRFVDEESRGEINHVNSEAIPPINREAIQWLDAYFDGKRSDNVPRLNPRGTDFQRTVWQTLLTIPYGQTKTYAEIAKMVGSRSARAVGQAVSRNPIAIIIPCHRVICADGSIGGYAYGIERKEQLLQMESAKNIIRHP